MCCSSFSYIHIQYRRELKPPPPMLLGVETPPPHRIFITLFSLLLILVEFPGVFPFLRHGAPPPPASTTTTTKATSSSLSRAVSNAPSSSSSASSSWSTSTSPPTSSSRERLLPKPGGAPPPPPAAPVAEPAPATTIPPLYVINWIPRGILYAFLGLVILEQSIVVLARDQARNASTTSRFLDSVFVLVSGWVMLGTGAMYVLLGSCCLQGVMERVRREDGERWGEYYDRVAELEAEMEGEEERELGLGGGGGGGGGPASSSGEFDAADASSSPPPDEDGATTMGGWVVGRAIRKFILGMRRRARGFHRRRRQWNRNGLCQFQLKCRTIDWKW